MMIMIVIMAMPNLIRVLATTEALCSMSSVMSLFSYRVLGLLGPDTYTILRYIEIDTYNILVYCSRHLQ